MNTINNIEQRLIGEKDWTMKGEITGKYRPVNSLLESNLDFKVTKRPPPIPSVEWSNKIENLIRIRVSNDLFDDPKRVSTKEKLKLNDINDQLVFEKSNKGLAELYEEDWYKENQEGGLKEVKSQEKKEIEEMVEELFDMFGKLTSNQFVGDRIKTEMNLIKDVESIELKDVSKHIISDKYIKNDFEKRIEEYNPIKAERTTNAEMSTEENKKRHRQMKRKVNKKLYIKEMKRKEKLLMKEYDSKFEVKLAMKQQKDKIENKNLKQKDLKSKGFFNNIQENENKKSKYIKKDE
jgi:U3 small nucleolar RNA-associated protein MPP10